MAARIVEQETGERLGQLGLADTGRTEEQERLPSGRLGSCNPARARRTAADTACDRRVLADHPLAQRVLHAEQFLALALHHPVDRDAGPAGDDAGDVLRGDLLLEHRPGARRLGLGQLAFEVWDGAVGQLAGTGIIAAALRLLDFEAGGVERLLDPRRAREFFLLRLPPRLQDGRLLLKRREFGFEIGEAFA